MSKADRDARNIQFVTGASYTTALNAKRIMRERLSPIDYRQYMAKVDLTEEWLSGERMRCVWCLEYVHETSNCAAYIRANVSWSR